MKRGRSSLPRRNIPAAAKTIEKERARVRRRYKVNLNKRKRYAPGEEDYIADTIVVLTLAGYSRTQMARIVGISKGQCKTILEMPHIAEKIEVLRKTLPQAALMLLHSYMIEAVQSIADVMRTSKRDEMVLKAAGEILDRGGAAKASRTEATVHNTTETRTTFADAGMVDALRKLPPEAQEQAAQMIESLENFLTEQAEKPAAEEKAENDEA